MFDRMTQANETEDALMSAITYRSQTYTLNLEQILISLYNANNHLTQITVTAPQDIFPSYTYPILKPQALSKTSASFLCPFLFASLSLDNFYKVLCSIYLEYSIIFVSDNLNVLTSSM